MDILFNKPATKLGLLINQIKPKLDKSHDLINIVCSELIIPKAASKQETNLLLPLSLIPN